MSTIIYKFENTVSQKHKNYIFQLVKERSLTKIYHSHDFYELVIFLNGSGIQLINDTEYQCEINSVTLLTPNDSHCFLKYSEDITVLSISIQKDEFEQIARMYEPSLLTSIQQQLQPIFHANLEISILNEYIDKKAPIVTEYDCKFIISLLLNMYINSTSCLLKNRELPHILSVALNEMKKTENLHQGIPALIKLSHFSQSHLSRLIKKHFNMTLKEYINELRLQSAYSEIIITQKPLESIASNVGFSSFSHFNKIFKARFSITPSQLRKNNGICTI